jgi:hypothetical protein
LVRVEQGAQRGQEAAKGLELLLLRGPFLYLPWLKERLEDHADVVDLGELVVLIVGNEVVEGGD